MQEDRLDEPLEKVFALFANGEIRPIAIEWARRRWKVVRVNSSWVDRSLRPHRRGYSLTMESGDVFRVSHAEGDPSWRLESVVAETP